MTAFLFRQSVMAPFFFRASVIPTKPISKAPCRKFCLHDLAVFHAHVVGAGSLINRDYLVQFVTSIMHRNSLINSQSVAQLTIRDQFAKGFLPSLFPIVMRAATAFKHSQRGQCRVTAGP